jgi:uncharacterized protein involved in response to NO
MKRLAIAPHRLYFFLGAIAVATLFFWWWLHLQMGSGLDIPLHALIMPLGVFPLFILGFTFTAGPKWINVDKGHAYFLIHGSTYFAGLMIVLIGSTLSWMPLRSSGFGLMLFAWFCVTWRWGWLLRLSPSSDIKHGISLFVAMCGGAFAILAALLWSVGVFNAWVIAKQLVFFAFLLPVFLTVCHRMLPFFTSVVIKPYRMWRPYSLLSAWIISCWGIAISSLLQWQMAETIIAAGLSMSFIYTSWRWGIFKCFSNRLLAMLHLSFAWLSIVFALQAITAWGINIGSAMVHALAMGFMATMLVGFVSRVSFGHSGRPLQVTNGLWFIYLSLHVTALLRVASSIFHQPQWMTMTASIWLVLILAWVARMLPIYLKERADGQAG